jgi:hypothetical protein
MKLRWKAARLPHQSGLVGHGYLMRTASHHLPDQEDEPWILVEPFRRAISAPEPDPAARIEVLLFGAFHLIAIFTPVTLSIMAIVGPGGFMPNVILAVALLLSGSMLFNYYRTLRAFAHKAARPRREVSDLNSASNLAAGHGSIGSAPQLPASVLALPASVLSI